MGWLLIVLEVEFLTKWLIHNWIHSSNRAAILKAFAEAQKARFEAQEAIEAAMMEEAAVRMGPITKMIDRMAAEGGCNCDKCRAYRLGVTADAYYNMRWIDDENTKSDSDVTEWYAKLLQQYGKRPRLSRRPSRISEGPADIEKLARHGSAFL